jgi:hypothetical protein
MNTKAFLIFNHSFDHVCLQAIKLNPFKFAGIMFLGHFYSNLTRDNKKALKCYQKTYEMCNNLNICGIELVDSLLKDNNEVN